MANRTIIPIGDFNQGGIADSKWSGIPNSLFKMIGFDPHTTPGILKVAQKMTKNSGSTVTEFCKARVASSNGATYWGSSTSGKIWQRASNGTWTLVYTVVPTTGTAYILNMIEFQGYIYIFTENYIHRILASGALGASQWTANAAPNWQVFTNGDDSFHPAFELNLVLYIGDGFLVAQIGDTGVFTGDSLDINQPLRVKSLGKMGLDLLVGTYVSDNVTKTQIYRWNTYSDSFSTSDTIDEVGVNAFLEADNFVYAQCGTAGNIYQYDGEKLYLYKKIPGTYSSTKQSTVYPNAVGSIEGQMLFGVSNTTGNPCDMGVYRIARNSMIYPYILDLPYPISERSGTDFVLSNIEIGAILTSGSNIFVAWKNSTVAETPTYGIDMLDYSNKLSGAYFETRIAKVIRDIMTNFTKFFVAYNLLPASTAIAIAYSKNYGSYDETTEQVDTQRNIVMSDGDEAEATTLQMKVTMTASSNDAPEIEGAGILYR